ncbi:hypothetical protein BDZ97DRAFT_812512 [Flammula alnicola]|nr:hypothetical protein BDZ97DRAFT_812512 [Flammula alnicola]
MSSPGSSEFASIHLSISWLNVLLYMLEITLAIYYLSHFTTERSLKVLLYGTLLADTICMVTVFASTWQLLINGAQSYSINEWRWTIILSTLMITIVSVVEELFLINRCRRLAQPIIITMVLLALVVAHAILNIYSGLHVAVFHGTVGLGFDTISRRYGNKAAAISACIAATVDVLIPLALTWQLYKITPKQIAKQRSYLDTIINSISSGGIGGVMSFVLLILFWLRPDVFYIFGLTMGRVYVNTLLVNLLVSKRTSSPYDLPDNTKIRKMSISAEIKLLTFSKKLSRHPSSPTEKQLPPTPDGDAYIEEA